MRRLLKAILIVCAVLFGGFGFAQNLQFPSAECCDNKRALQIIEKARSFGNNNQLDSCLYWVKKAKSMTRDSSILVTCFRIESQVHMLRSDIGNSLAASMMGLRLLTTDAKYFDIVRLHNVAGTANMFNGQFSDAFEHFYNALWFAERTKDNDIILSILSNLGVLHYKMYDNETACKFWEEALTYNSNLENRIGCKMNVALASVNLGRYETASNILNELRAEVDEMRTLKSSYYYTFGTLYDSLNRIDSARYFFLKSLELSKDKNHRFEAESILSLSRLMIKEGKYDSASMMLAKADQLAREQSYVDILSRTTRARHALAIRGSNIRELLEAQEQVVGIWDKFYGANLSRISAMHKARKLREEFEKRRSIYQRQGTENKKIQELQSSFGVLISVIGVAAMVTVVLLIYSYSIQKRNERSLSGIVKMRVKYLDSRTKAVEKLLEEKAIVVQKWDFKSSALIK